MGHGIDKVSKGKQVDDQFGYNKEGVLSFLEEYYKIQEELHFSYNNDLLDTKLDFERAMTAYILEPEMRVALALRYGLQLDKFPQMKRISGLDVKDIKASLEEAVETVEAVVNGFKTAFKKTKPSQATTVEQWLAEVAEGITHIFDVPDDVITNLLELSTKDKQAQETLRQRIEGAPLLGENGLFDIMGYFDYDYTRYPFFVTSPEKESPNRRQNEYVRQRDGYDYFAKKDEGEVFYDADDFAHIAKGAKITGKRTVSNGPKDDENGGQFNGKGSVYGR